MAPHASPQNFEVYPVHKQTTRLLLGGFGQALPHTLGRGDFEVNYKTSRSCTKRQNPEVAKLR